MPFGAAIPSAHPPYDSRPVELELRMATASARSRRHRPLENAAAFVVQLVLPLSQSRCSPQRTAPEASLRRPFRVSVHASFALRRLCLSDAAVRPDGLLRC